MLKCGESCALLKVKSFFLEVFLWFVWIFPTELASPLALPPAPLPRNKHPLFGACSSNPWEKGGRQAWAGDQDSHPSQAPADGAPRARCVLAVTWATGGRGDPRLPGRGTPSTRRSAATLPGVTHVRAGSGQLSHLPPPTSSRAPPTPGPSGRAGRAGPRAHPAPSSPVPPRPPPSACLSGCGRSIWAATLTRCWFGTGSGLAPTVQARDPLGTGSDVWCRREKASE